MQCLNSGSGPWWVSCIASWDPVAVSCPGIIVSGYTEEWNAPRMNNAYSLLAHIYSRSECAWFPKSARGGMLYCCRSRRAIFCHQPYNCS
jgi:hypothetical protein